MKGALIQSAIWGAKATSQEALSRKRAKSIKKKRQQTNKYRTRGAEHREGRPSRGG